MGGPSNDFDDLTVMFSRGQLRACRQSDRQWPSSKGMGSLLALSPHFLLVMASTHSQLSIWSSEADCEYLTRDGHGRATTPSGSDCAASGGGTRLEALASRLFPVHLYFLTRHAEILVPGPRSIGSRKSGVSLRPSRASNPSGESLTMFRSGAAEQVTT